MYVRTDQHVHRSYVGISTVQTYWSGLRATPAMRYPPTDEMQNTGIMIIWSVTHPLPSKQTLIHYIFPQSLIWSVLRPNVEMRKRVPSAQTAHLSLWPWIIPLDALLYRIVGNTKDVNPGPIFEELERWRRVSQRFLRSCSTLVHIEGYIRIVACGPA
jgi:hypothetical protein